MAKSERRNKGSGGEEPHRILHVITGLSDGGAEAVLFRLCATDSITHHHVVSLMDAGKYGPLLENVGVSVTCLNMPRGRATFTGLSKLWRLIRKERPDVVQTWMYHADLLGGVIARLAGSPNVNWGIHNTTLSPGESTTTTILVAKLCARLSRFVPRHIVCCAERARTVHVALGYNHDRMRVIPNGYDLAVFRPDEPAGDALRATLAIELDEPLLGFVARYDAQKDHANLLQSLALLKARGLQPKCLLVGTGMESDNQPLIAMVSELGLTGQIRLLGRRDDIPAVMNALDLHVMSSAFGEAFPNVLAEAMACGTPCISTDVGDAAAIVGETGWIVPPRDPEALAGAIAEALALRNAAGWAQRQLAARRHIVANYAIDKMVERFHAVWSADGHRSN